MNSLYLVRGVPGSGKTTMVDTLTQFMDNNIFSVLAADQFFEGPNGEYHFDPKRLSEAHTDCLWRTAKAIAKGLPHVFVTNTFTQEWEMEKYFALANENGYQVFTLVVENRHGNESVHNVPAASMDKMRKRFEISL